MSERNVSIDYDRWLYLEGLADYFGKWRKGDAGALALASNRYEWLRHNRLENGDRLRAIQEIAMREETMAMLAMYDTYPDEAGFEDADPNSAPVGRIGQQKGMKKGKAKISKKPVEIPRPTASYLAMLAFSEGSL